MSLFGSTIGRKGLDVSKEYFEKIHDLVTTKRLKRENKKAYDLGVKVMGMIALQQILIRDETFLFLKENYPDIYDELQNHLDEKGL